MKLRAIAARCVAGLVGFGRRGEHRSGLLILAALVAFPAVASAQVSGARRQCVDVPLSAGSVVPVVDAVAMTASPSFTYNLDNTQGGYDIAVLWIALTDANTSITRFDTTCTVSRNGNTTDYVPQVCDDTSDGICTQTDGNVFQKASPGTKLWPIRLDVGGYPDIECAFTVGAGAATAVSDVLTVYLRLCTG